MLKKKIKFTQRRDFLILNKDDLLKIPTKIIQEVIRSLRAKILHEERKLCTPGFFTRKFLRWGLFFNKL